MVYNIVYIMVLLSLRMQCTKIMKTLFNKQSTIFLLIIGLFAGAISGCTKPVRESHTQTMVKETTMEECKDDYTEEEILQKFPQINEQLKLLQKNLLEQTKLSTQLQLTLLEKHAEINKLLIENQRLVTDFVRNKPQLQKRGNRVETVRLLAEVATIIDTAKTMDRDGTWKETIRQAEQYLTESQIEIDNNNLDGASYLAGQAMELIQITQQENSNQPSGDSIDEILFVVNLPMKTLKNANVRATPSLQADILFVQKADSQVNAEGYSGIWIKIQVDNDTYGWIHYSLLSSAL